ncbi:MAG: long-chain fatty acid--CoA ligase [Thalassobaculum sp.]|uniref:acyl-CoA synthetase n=1 Tax=Thalassobaculum sp. TaxID=2022740 RepID=UPI0032EED3AD
MNQAKVLAQVARSFGERPAMSLGERVLYDYRTFADRVARLAGGLRALGLASGDRVALVMKNGPEYFEVMYGAWHAGLVAVPVNAKLHPKEHAYILDHSGSRACVASPDIAEALATVRDELPGLEHTVVTGTAGYDALLAHDPVPVAPVAPDDLAWLFYTSGTTGRPKGAMLTHRNLMVAVMNYFGDVDTILPTDCMIHSAPMSHGSGLYGLPHVAKAANTVIPESGGFDVAETLRLIERWPGCSFFFAPTMVTRLINTPHIGQADLANLKTIVYGGAPMYLEDVKRALDVLGPKLAQIYGQGEAPMTITGLPKHIYVDRDHPKWERRIGSTGFPRTDVEVRVVDEDGNDLPDGETGEVICRGDIVMAGYWNNPEATATSIRDGWLWTGDVGAFDEDGFLSLKDRSKDVIISGGTNIYPREVEEVLLRHPEVLECAVVGRPHQDWGEEVVAFVRPRPGAEVALAELDRLCLDNIARFKRPKEYRMVADLPKNNYGKILKTELRRQLGEPAG